jgi:hypothetical protein
MTAAVTATYRIALAAVPSSEARPTLTRGFLTRLAVIAATSTPMKVKQRHAGRDADRAVQAAARGVERPEVPLGHEEPADHADVQQRQELQHYGQVLEPGHLLDADQVDDGRDPQAAQGDAPVAVPRRVDAE